MNPMRGVLLEKGRERAETDRKKEAETQGSQCAEGGTQEAGCAPSGLQRGCDPAGTLISGS